MTLRIDTSRGILIGARQVTSPNFDARPEGSAIELLVIHGISLPPGEFGGPYIEDLFTNRLNPDTHPFFRAIYQTRVSAHLLIRRDGEVVQFVPFHARAWHAGASNFCGRERCNDFSIGIELEGADDIPYSDAQYHALGEVVAALQSAYPALTRERIVGHCDIAPQRKTDPGPAFEWGRFFSGLDTSRSA